jgi:hypothetical protein
MPFVDGQRFGKIQVHKIDDNVEPAEDKKGQPSPSEQALLPKAREVRTERPRFDLVYARVDETPQGKESDDSTPERVCWVYQNKLVSTPHLLKGPGYAFDIDPEQGKGLFMTRKALIEADLASGATVELSFKHWPVRNPPSGAGYLVDGQILMHSSVVAVGTRVKQGVELHRALEIRAQGLSLMKQRVLFFSDESTLIIGYDRGVFRELANLGVWADAPWLVSPDRFRFYVDPFHNEDLPPESCGTFELSGALDAWEDCFTKQHGEGYPELAQESLA